MVHFVGLDVSVKETSVCVVDDAGKVIFEQKILTEPADIIALLDLARRELRPDRDRGRAAVAVAGQCVDGGRAAGDLRRDASSACYHRSCGRPTRGGSGMEWLGWEWGRFFMMIVSAGVGSALVQSLMPIYRDRRTRRKQAAYMAMRLAVVMENFAWACANFIQDNHTARTPPDEEYPAWEIALPELLAYPEDADGWRAIAPKLAGRVFGLRNKLHESKSTIRNIIEFNKEELG